MIQVPCLEVLGGRLVASANEVFCWIVSMMSSSWARLTSWSASPDRGRWTTTDSASVRLSNRPIVSASKNAGINTIARFPARIPNVWVAPNAMRLSRAGATGFSSATAAGQRTRAHKSTATHVAAVNATTCAPIKPSTESSCPVHVLTAITTSKNGGTESTTL